VGGVGCFLAGPPGLNGFVLMRIQRSVLHSFNCAPFAVNYRQNPCGGADARGRLAEVSLSSEAGPA